MDIKLRDYQQEAIDSIYGTENSDGLYKEHDFASVFLPTGGGKSFVAMKSMIEMMQPSSRESEGIISETPMLYFAPNIPIIEQYRIHMAQNMIFENSIENITGGSPIERGNVAQIVQEVLKRFNEKIELSQEDLQAINQYVESNTDKSADEITRSILKRELVKQEPKIIEEGVKKAFPNLQFKCYQAMRSRSIKDSSKKAEQSENEEEKTFFVEDVDADFVIFDEAHRCGAGTWIQYIDKLVDSQKRKAKASKKATKFLAITATPERDIDDYSAISNVALKTGYSVTDVRQKKYVAQDLRLIEAMEEGKVVTPKVIHLDCTLDDTKAYREVRSKVEELEGKRSLSSKDSDQLQAYKVILTRMHILMGREAGMTDEEWAQRKTELINEAIRNSGVNPNAKGIGFIPRTPDNQDSRQHVTDSAEKISGIISGALGGTPFVRGYHSALRDKENEENLRIFNSAPTETGGVKVLITNSKLNEGVHVDETDTLFMFDEIRPNDRSLTENPKIKFMQQIGRCITSIDPAHPERAKQPIIFDFAHNFLWQHNILKGSNGKPFFDISPSEEEFIKLYNVFLHNPTRISYFMPEGLRDPRSYSPQMAVAAGTFAFTMRETDENGKKVQIRFPNEDESLTNLGKPIIKGANQEKGKRYNSKGLPITEVAKLKTEDRLNKAMKFATTLKKYGLDISKIDETIPFSEEFLEANGITGKLKDKLLDELYLDIDTRKVVENMDILAYPLGEEIKFFREAFFDVKGQSNAQTKKYFSKMDFKKMVNSGVLSVDLLDVPENLQEGLSENGFVIPSEGIPKKFWGLNIVTGEKYDKNGRDEFGLDESGYDICGYDKDGFYKDGYHRITRQKYDERFFRRIVDPETSEITWTNIETGEQYDLLGYNHDGIDRRGFDKKGLWHKEGPDFRVGKEKDPDGANRYGFKKNIFLRTGGKIDDYGFHSNGEHDTGYYAQGGAVLDKKRDPKGFDIDGYDQNNFSRSRAHRKTTSKYGPDGLDAEGKLHPDLKVLQELVVEIKRAKGNKVKIQEIQKKYSSQQYDGRDINTVLDSALTAYAMYGEYKLPEIPSEDKKIVFGTIESLSGKFKAQMARRTIDKNNMLEGLNYKLREIAETRIKLESEQAKLSAEDREAYEAKMKALKQKEAQIQGRSARINSDIIAREEER